MIATLPPEHHWFRLWTWAAYLWRGLRQSPAALKERRASRSSGGASARADHARAHHTAQALRAVAASALKASAAYRPVPYAGELTIFEPTSRDLALPSSVKRWRRYARAVRQHSLPGRHDNMLAGANAETAADLLTRCLEAAAAR
jgi:thioesterase domain-containing protein